MKVEQSIKSKYTKNEKAKILLNVERVERRANRGDWRDDTGVKITGCSARGPVFNSQQPQGGPQPSMRSDALFWHAYIYRQKHSFLKYE